MATNPAPRTELLPTVQQEFDPWQSRNDVRQAVTALALHTAGQAIVESQAQDNVWMTAPAPSSATSYPATLNKPHTNVLGTPGTVLKSLVVGPNGSCQLVGIRVLGSVTLMAGSVLLATNCRFDSLVSMNAGARAHFIGCFLNGVNNAGLPANAYIIGCHQDSGADFGVTIIAETV